MDDQSGRREIAERSKRGRGAYGVQLFRHEHSIGTASPTAPPNPSRIQNAADFLHLLFPTRSARKKP